jgi:hypothetical protein
MFYGRFVRVDYDLMNVNDCVATRVVVSNARMFVCAAPVATCLSHFDLRLDKLNHLSPFRVAREFKAT